jgi:hypothetical protein
MSEHLYIDWIHPSGRDAAIDYLARHNLERVAFLRTARLPGMMLALSTQGGNTGSRQLPLLLSEQDWDALEMNLADRSESMPESDFYSLLGGVLNGLTTDRKVDTTTRAQLISFAEHLLRVCVESWNRDSTQLSVRCLALYYDLSVHVDLLVPAPDLNPLWLRITSNFDNQFDEARDDSTLPLSCDRLIELTHLMTDNEPRFLRISGHAADVEKRLTALIDAWIQEVDRMDDLDPDEEVEESACDGQVYWIPVEPSGDEYQEKQWLNSRFSALDDIQALDLRHVVDVSVLRDLMNERANQRESREERYDEWQREGQQDEDRWTESRDEPTAEFDVSELFADL